MAGDPVPDPVPEPMGEAMVVCTKPRLLDDRPGRRIDRTTGNSGPDLLERGPLGLGHY